MGPKKGIKSKVNGAKGVAGVPDEDQITISENQSDLSDSQNSKRKREQDDFVSSSLSTPAAKSSSFDSTYTSVSSAISSAQTSSFSSVTSTSSGNFVLASTNTVKALPKGRSSTKSHVTFSVKKHTYLQDSLDLVEEVSLELNDEKVYNTYIFF
jgi:hypothetical protein